MVQPVLRQIGFSLVVSAIFTKAVVYLQPQKSLPVDTWEDELARDLTRVGAGGLIGFAF